MKGIFLSLFAALVLSFTAKAEDWTVNGKLYRDVAVGQVEPDRVHISYDGGIGSLPLADLPPDLQKRFNYDPEKAKAATDQRQKATDNAINDLAKREEDQNPEFLQNWTMKVQQETADASTPAQHAHAQTQQLRLQIFANLITSSSSKDAREAIKGWMDAVMTDSVCEGMPRGLVLAAWGPPDSETKDSDGTAMMVYGHSSSYVYLSNDVVTRVSVTTADASP